MNMHFYTELRIGIVGYSAKKFDKELAKRYLITAINNILVDAGPNVKVTIISGLTNIGIPAIAYQFAKENKWKTVGIACPLAVEFDCFPVDERVIVGDKWGDESEFFLKNINVLIRIGGGAQSLAETEQAKKRGMEVYEYELPTMN